MPQMKKSSPQPEPAPPRSARDRHLAEAVIAQYIHELHGALAA
jgi:hypothetical protein